MSVDTPVYRIVNKRHLRSTMKTRTVVDNGGNVHHVEDNGDPIIFDVGAVLSDVTPEELAAFPDKFVLVSGEPDVRPVGQRVNPDLYALIERAHNGDATNDEQDLVGPVLAFLTAHARGADTEEQRDALGILLADWDMPLFV